MLLDNFEQLLPARPLGGGSADVDPPLRLLVTSRAPLHVRGEREYAVGPLELGVGLEAMPPADVARIAAVRLFVERVRDVQADLRLTTTNVATVTAICRRLDRLPLALELAAPWLTVLSLEELLRRLTDDVLVSTVGPRDLPERQQTMNATVAWSYRLLTPDDQRAFPCFGALPGRFPLDAAAAVLAGRENVFAGHDEALRATASLRDKSLLLRSDTSVVTTCGLYYMLDTVRAYAARELTASGDRNHAMEGLVHYCTAEAVLVADGLVGQRRRSGWIACAKISRATAAPRSPVPCSSRATQRMAALLLATGDAQGAERLLDQATSALRDVGPWFLAVTLYVRAIVAIRRGTADEAVALVREAPKSMGACTCSGEERLD